MMEPLSAGLAEVFGDSDDEDGHKADTNGEARSYLNIAGICGLHLVKNLVTKAHQVAILSGIAEEGWFANAGIDQAMRFGDLPSWTEILIQLVPKDLLPEQVRDRAPLFNQIAVNRYKPGEGLKAHVDLHPSFEDGVCIFSFASAAVITFKPCTLAEQAAIEHSPKEHRDWKMVASIHPDLPCVDVLLEPGDMVAMSGVARYQWTHGIRATAVDRWKGTEIKRGCRTSVTLRRLRALPGA